MAEVEGVPEQQVSLVAQLQAERENAVAYGDKGRVESIDRKLADLGVKKKAAEKRAEADARHEPPKKAAAAAERHSTR